MRILSEWTHSLILALAVLVLFTYAGVLVSAFFLLCVIMYIVDVASSPFRRNEVTSERERKRDGD